MAFVQVEIRYDGWGPEYNEWVNVNSARLAPFHMYTIVKKCWAKLTKWPWWPAFVRMPLVSTLRVCLMSNVCCIQGGAPRAQYAKGCSRTERRKEGVH